MTIPTRFGKKLKVPSTFQIKHQLLLFWLKNQVKKEAADDSMALDQKGYSEANLPASIVITSTALARVRSGMASLIARAALRLPSQQTMTRSSLRPAR